MSLEVFGNYNEFSTCTQRVLTALNFHGVKDFKFNVLSFASGDIKKPEYLKIQPFGQIPAIKHGDFVLFESRPIVRYLDSVFATSSGKALLPADPKLRALAEQWLSVDHDNIQPALRSVLIHKHLWRSPVIDEIQLKADFDIVSARLDILDAHLAKSKSQYFVGDEFSIVEVSFLPYFTMYYKLGGEYAEQVDSRPHLGAWWARTRSHQAWIATLNAIQK